MGRIQVKKPKAILFDLSGTATKSYFTDQVLFPYIRNNCEVYLHNNWENAVLQRDIARLREQSNQDGGPKVIEGDKKETISSIVAYVNKSLDELRGDDAISIFR